MWEKKTMFQPRKKRHTERFSFAAITWEFWFISFRANARRIDSVTGS